MKIEFDLSEKAVRMIKALQVLSGEENHDIKFFISSMIEGGLKDRIAAEIGVDFTDQAPMIMAPTKELVEQPHFTEEDITGVSDGLGDDAPDYEEEEDAPVGEPKTVDPELEDYNMESEAIVGEKDPMAFVDKAPPVAARKVTKRGRGKASTALEEEVGGTESPIHSRSQAEQAVADEHPEETFSQMALGMPFSVAVTPGEEVDPRARRRMHKNTRARRANVVDFTEDNAVEATL